MLTVSEAATRKIQEVITQQRGSGSNVYGLRLSVYPGGCSGFQYGMALADKIEAGDWEGDFGGVKVLVDADSQALLEGVAIDYVETVQAQGFTISQPERQVVRLRQVVPVRGGRGRGREPLARRRVWKWWRVRLRWPLTPGPAASGSRCSRSIRRASWRRS